MQGKETPIFQTGMSQQIIKIHVPVDVMFSIPYSLVQFVDIIKTRWMGTIK